MAKPSRDSLFRLLEGLRPDEAQLASLIRQCAEDQWLDYKAGVLLQMARASAVVREYVLSFANAEGGTLVIGSFSSAQGERGQGQRRG